MDHFSVEQWLTLTCVPSAVKINLPTHTLRERHSWYVKGKTLSISYSPFVASTSTSQINSQRILASWTSPSNSKRTPQSQSREDLDHHPPPYAAFMAEASLPWCCWSFGPYSMSWVTLVGALSLGGLSRLQDNYRTFLVLSIFPMGHQAVAKSILHCSRLCSVKLPHFEVKIYRFIIKRATRAFWLMWTSIDGSSLGELERVYM